MRFFSPLLGLGTSLIVFFFARRVYNERVAIWTVLLLNAIPIFNVGAVVMTIDPLSIFFWAASVFTFWLALEKSPAFSWWWPFTGLLIGLGFLAKYTNAMELLSILILLGCDPAIPAGPARRRVLVDAGGLPALHGAGDPVESAARLDHARASLGARRIEHRLRPASGRVFAIPWRALPGLFAAGVHRAALEPLVGGERARMQFKPRFLGAFAVPLLVMYAALAFKNPGEPNWTAPAFITLGILGTALWLERAAESAALRRFAIASLVLAMVMTTVTLNPDILRVCPHPILLRLRSRAAACAAGRPARRRSSNSAINSSSRPGKPVFLIGNKYQTSASLSFYMTDHRVEGPGHPPVYIPESQDIENEFSFWPQYDEFDTPPPGTAPPDAVLHRGGGGESLRGAERALHHRRVADRRRAPPTAIERGFEQVELVRLFRIERRGQPLRELRVFACYNYRTLSL